MRVGGPGRVHGNDTSMRNLAEVIRKQVEAFKSWAIPYNLNQSRVKKYVSHKSTRHHWAGEKSSRSNLDFLTWELNPGTATTVASHRYTKKEFKIGVSQRIWYRFEFEQIYLLPRLVRILSHSTTPTCLCNSTSLRDWTARIMGETRSRHRWGWMDAMDATDAVEEVAFLTLYKQENFLEQTWDIRT